MIIAEKYHIYNKNLKMKTKKVTISLTTEQQDKARSLSKGIFGKENISGYIQILIEAEFKKARGKNLK